MDALAEAAGDIRIARHREDEGARGIGGGAAVRSLVAAGVGGCRSRRGALSLELCHQHGDRHIRGVLLGCDLGDLGLPVIIIRFQAQQQLRGLVDLGLELFLLQAQGVLFAVDLLAVALILSLQLLGVFPGLNVIVLQLLIPRHDLLHVVHGCEHFAQVIGLEDHREVVEGPVFLHGAHAGAVAHKLVLLALLGVENFLFLIGDHLIIQGDLLIVKLDLLHGVHVAFIQSALLHQNADSAFGKLVDLGLLCLALRLDYGALSPEGFKLCLGDLRPGLCRQQPGHDADAEDAAEESQTPCGSLSLHK